MPAPNLDIYGFSQRITQLDLARSNLFVVLIGDPSVDNSNEGDSGFLDSVMPFADLGYEIASQQSETFRRVSGAWSPNIIRSFSSSSDFYNTLMGNGVDTITMKQLALMTKSVQLPGTSLSTTENKHRRTDGPQHIITGRTNDAVTMRFYMTPKQTERMFFDNWINSLYNLKSNQAAFIGQQEREIEIFTYNRQGIAETQTILHGAFPVRIGSIELDADTNNQVSTIEIEFKYKAFDTRIVPNSDKNIGDLRAQATSITRRAKNLTNIF